MLVISEISSEKIICASVWIVCISLSNTPFISNCFSEIAVTLKTVPSLRMELMFGGFGGLFFFV